MGFFLVFLIASLVMVVLGFKQHIIWGIALLFLPVFGHIVFVLLNRTAWTITILIIELVSLFAFGRSQNVAISIF